MRTRHSTISCVERNELKGKETKNRLVSQKVWIFLAISQATQFTQLFILPIFLSAIFHFIAAVQNCIVAHCSNVVFIAPMTILSIYEYLKTVSPLHPVVERICIRRCYQLFHIPFKYLSCTKKALVRCNYNISVKSVFRS